MERMTSPPFGLLGGQAGAPAVVTMTTSDGSSRRLPGKGAFSAPAGSVIEMVTPGSGGFGPAAKRDPAAVGTKVTLTVHAAPAASELPQVLIWRKSPLAAMPTIAAAALPVLPTDTVCGALVDCTACVPNVRVVGETPTIAEDDDGGALEDGGALALLPPHPA